MCLSFFGAGLILGGLGFGGFFGGGKGESGERGEEYIKEGPNMWGIRQVTYFKQRRVMEFNKAQTLEKLVKEGAKPVELGAGPVEEKGKA